MDIRFVSGFLGSGKTTFLAEYLRRSQKRVGVIVNDFGDVSADIELLKGLTSTVKDVSGGSMFCACKKEAFLTTLALYAQSDLDEIMVETSGFSNPSNLLTLLDEIKGPNHLRHRGLITIVDANIFEKISATCRAAREQIVRADLLLVSKMDLSEDTIETMQVCLRKHNVHAPVHRLDHGRYEESWLKGMRVQDTRGMSIMDMSLRSITLKFTRFPDEATLERLLADIWPYTERIKGTVIDHDVHKYVEYDEQGLKSTLITPSVQVGLTLLGRSPVMDMKAIETVCQTYGFVYVA